MSSSAAADYTAEVRLAVVMYGGVSLAIYINGVANELFELASSTPHTGRMPPPEGTVSGTREVYRRLSYLAADPDLVKRYREWLTAREKDPMAPDPLDPQAGHAGVRSRFVIDVISGTSAGGINGVFLAKALANAQRFAPLRKLWVEEGDIGLLLNDRASYRGLPSRLRDRSAEPASLLNGDRMYLKLIEAMRAMAGDKPAAPPAPSPWVQELDLFVTTTDIEGSLVALRLFDKLVHEKRHRQVFHLRYCDDGDKRVLRNDLKPELDQFLAFAARCTSSFPFAFEPMTLRSIERVEGRLDDARLREWNRFFGGLPHDEVERLAHAQRAFGDGGYLDNKPFSHAVAAISTRTAAVPVERKLIYIEPAPGHPERERARDAAPDAISNSLAALTSIPRYETIREDLEAVLKRNRRIERIDRIVRLGEVDLDRYDDDPFVRVMLDDKGRLPDWDSLTLDQLRRYYGDAFVPYRRLRMFTVTDELADRLGRVWAIDRESDHLYALRALVRAWRDEHFSDGAGGASTGMGGNVRTTSSFLGRFDLQYRVRRTGFLLRKTDQLIRLVRRQQRDSTDALSDADAMLLRRLERARLPLPAADKATLAEALDALLVLKEEFARAYASLRAATSLIDEHPPMTPRRQALRPELLRTLDAMLLHGDGVLALRTKAGTDLPVEFPPELLRLPSPTRTLQEGVFERARWLLKTAREFDETELQDALQDDIEEIAQEFDALLRLPPDDARAAAKARGAARVRARLGNPRLTLADSVLRVEVQEVGDPVLDTVSGKLLRRFFGEYYLRFDSFDQMSFPLYHDTDAGEPATVEVVRISPEDAPALIDESRPSERRRKLAGTALANFGAFLQRHWRDNDIMWGRLDGAERLIAALLPAADADAAAVREELTRQAHRAILAESLTPGGYGNLQELLCDAIAEGARAKRDVRVIDLVERLAPATPEARRRLELIVASLLADEKLLHYVRERRDVDRQAAPRAVLDSASRAVTIGGRVLQGIAKRHGREQPGLRWVARSGLAAQGLIAVAIPGSLEARWWSHGLKVLYAFELAALLFGLLLGSEPMRSAALTALGVTAIVHLTTLLLGDVLRSKSRWWVKTVCLVVVPVVLLAGLGIWALVKIGWQGLLPGA